MEKKKKTKTAVVVLIGCAAALWLGSLSGAANNRYEINADVPLSYQSPSNTVMVLDAYERLMDNYMSLVQSNLNAVSGDVSQSARQLTSIDRKLDSLNVRLARIERALSIQTVSGSPPLSGGEDW
ncbi:MAG: hypothetical protein IH624_18100 [Phycisphaerae bacterium]|nr:hypothetical protein [Phycisphaerae bacterium]